MNKMKTLLVSGVSAALLVSSASSAFAAAANGSFENGTNPGSYSTLTAVDLMTIGEWKVATGSVDYIGSYWQAADGTRSIDLSGTGAGSVSQNLTTVANHTYKVTFALAGNPDGGDAVKSLTATAGATSAPFTFDTTGHDKTNMGWTTKSFTFVAPGTETLLTFTSNTNSAYGPAIDNVVVEDTTTAQVPAQCDQNVSYNVIEGTSTSDVLTGTNGADLILAKNGSDVVDGKGGNDCIVGGEGSDVLKGGNGADVLLGGLGSDSLFGDNGHDKLYGEEGSDALKGGEGNDNLYGGAGSDGLLGETGNDTADGGADSDGCVAETKIQCNP